MAGVDRYGNPYNGRKRGRKPVDRMGMKTLPSKLKASIAYYWAHKEEIKQRRRDRVTKDPSIPVKEGIRRKQRAYERLKAEMGIKTEVGYKKTA